MSLQETLSNYVKQAVKANFNIELESVEFQATRKEFVGDITIVIFPMLRFIKGNPVQIGEITGNYLVENVSEVKAFNVVKGFLNIEISDVYYMSFFNSIKDDRRFGFVSPKAEEKAIMVEYSSPNTNKPLHLGHVRNNLLGYSVAEILKASGKKVYKTQIINDRGIHICKSMLAWKSFGNEETPDSSGLKGDKLVGNYYVKFDEKFRGEMKEKLNSAFTQSISIIQEQFNKGVANIGRAMRAADVHYNGAILRLANVKMDWIEYKSNEIKFNNYSRSTYDILYSNVFEHLLENENHAELIDSFNEPFQDDLNLYFENGRVKILEDLSKKYFSEDSILQQEAQKMLLKWEAGDKDVVSLWKKMNGWVYDGFAETYKNLGVDFDTLYYESNTYLLGKEFVAEGLKSGVFIKEEDGSVWCDLTEDGLDKKIVQRADGTAVYMTQDIGTAIQRIKDFPDVGGMVYTVGNEQDYHFQVLFLILQKLGFDWAKNLYHLSYGMVDLPSGKMKSREGTVVDADDLIDDMASTAEEISEELGKLEGYSQEEKQELYKSIGLGALKYYVLKVDPKKRILFDPKESIDFQGNTGPFIQYTYARIQSILRKADLNSNVKLDNVEVQLHPKEKELIKQIQLFPEVVQNAAHNHSPALIANYTYDLVKEFNSFYQNVSILGADNESEKALRVQLSHVVANTIKNSFGLLGIHVPERM